MMISILSIEEKAVPRQTKEEFWGCSIEEPTCQAASRDMMLWEKFRRAVPFVPIRLPVAEALRGDVSPLAIALLAELPAPPFPRFLGNV